MPDIFISTSCLGGTRDLREILEIYRVNGIRNVELSGGLDCMDDAGGVLDDYRNFDFLIHNYFPPAKEPFILNLAAQDHEIREKSVALCKRSINLCRRIGCKIYTFHPGFRVERTLGPNFDMVGSKLVSYDLAFSNFMKSIEDMSAYAKGRGIKIAVENLEHRNEAYMMTRPHEFANFHEIFPEVGVLLDLGHLKIASKRCGFEVDEFIRAIQDNIVEIHIHENDGEWDLHKEPLAGSLMEYLRTIDCNIIVLESRNLNLNGIILNLDALKQIPA